jgi:hypothetical protein
MVELDPYRDFGHLDRSVYFYETKKVIRRMLCG